MATKKELQEQRELLLKEIDRLQSEIDFNNAQQMALKNTINGSYGAFANAGFACSSNEIANSITAMGRDISKYVASVADYYWKNEWHLDEEAHQKVGATNVQKISDNAEIVVYGDTDSCASDSLIKTNQGEFEIEDLWSRFSDVVSKSQHGHEIKEVSGLKVATWTREKGFYYAPVKRLIRHKVTKKKYRLRSSSGKEVVVTGDHSIHVIRAGQSMAIKAKEVLAGDQLVTII